MLTVDNQNYESSSACYLPVDINGDCTFEGVPPGNYLMQPIVENADLTVHIAPHFIEFEVLKDTLQIRDEFKVCKIRRIGWYGTKKVPPARIINESPTFSLYFVKGNSNYKAYFQCFFRSMDI